MKLGELQFKPEDFVDIMDTIRNSPKVPFVWQEIVYIANRANELLEQRLGKGGTVELIVVYSGDKK